MAILIITLALAGGGVGAQSLPDRTIDRAVISKLKAQFGINSKVIRHLDLTQPFQTKSAWAFVVAKQPDEESSEEDGSGTRTGVVSLCFVKNGEPDCADETFPEKYRREKGNSKAGRFYEFFLSDVVFSGPERTLPLLRIRTCSLSGMNGNCGVSTFLFDYDRNLDGFRLAFFESVGRNNNEEIRFVESGPLLGHVIIAFPTNNAPFTYFVEIYRRIPSGIYSQVLRYRGKTHYGDGNRLAVIDSEMPEILQRMGHWKPGDALPAPPRMPRGCTHLVMRKGVLWCQP